MAETKTIPAVTQWIRRALRAATDLVYPPLCTACGVRVDEAHALCARCWSKISFLDGPCCAGCGLPFEIDPGEGTLCAACYAKPRHFDSARALFSYDEGSKGLILAFKYSDRLDHAPAFARWLGRAGQELFLGTDIVTPVPLHRWRLWKRRYNQSAILAQKLATMASVPCEPQLLERRRATPSQGSMPSAKARRRNVFGAFRVSQGFEDAVRGRSILLVDDVFTTGATLDACAKALKRAGASRVNVLTLARVVRPAASDI